MHAPHRHHELPHNMCAQPKAPAALLKHAPARSRLLTPPTRHGAAQPGASACAAHEVCVCVRAHMCAGTTMADGGRGAGCLLGLVCCAPRRRGARLLRARTAPRSGCSRAHVAVRACEPNGDGRSGNAAARAPPALRPGHAAGEAYDATYIMLDYSDYERL